MNKLDKILLFKDLEESTNSFNTKKEKLELIINLYAEDFNITKTEPSNNESIVDEEIKDEPIINEPIKDEPIKDDIQEEVIEDDIPLIELPQSIKNIYHKIVKITHPDKIIDTNNFELYINYYKNVVNAKNTNNKYEILYIAYLLNIDELFNLPENDLGSIRRRLKEIEIETRTVENNIFWVYHYTDDLELKQYLFKKISKLNPL